MVQPIGCQSGLIGELYSAGIVPGNNYFDGQEFLTSCSAQFSNGSVD
jgi:hypothetical protein